MGVVVSRKDHNGWVRETDFNNYVYFVRSVKLIYLKV